MTDLTARIAEIISKHQLARHDRRAWWCLCGADCLNTEGAYSAHVAALIAAEVDRWYVPRPVTRSFWVSLRVDAERHELAEAAEQHYRQLQSEQDEDRDELHTLRRHLADEEGEVERLKGALDRVQQFEPALRMPADHNIPPRYQQFVGSIRDAVADELRDMLRGDQ